MFIEESRFPIKILKSNLECDVISKLQVNKMLAISLYGFNKYRKHYVQWHLNEIF